MGSIRLLSGRQHNSNWQSLIEETQDTNSRGDIALSKFGTIVSYSRLLSAKGKKDDGLGLANQAAAALAELHCSLPTSTPRQSLELDIALLEATESDLEPAMKLEKWDELVTMAEPLQEHGIQSMYLSRYGQAAAAAKAYAEIDRHHGKLEAIEKTLERDWPSVLVNQCGIWRAGDRNGWAAMLE